MPESTTCKSDYILSGPVQLVQRHLFYFSYGVLRRHQNTSDHQLTPTRTVLIGSGCRVLTLTTLPLRMHSSARRGMSITLKTDVKSGDTQSAVEKPIQSSHMKSLCKSPGCDKCYSFSYRLSPLLCGNCMTFLVNCAGQPFCKPEIFISEMAILK